jgi:hypothetical protein
MDYPTHYLAIKPIFDLCLFGIENAEEHFATSQKLKFKEEFLAYHKEFLSKEDYCDHELLLQTCYRYLSNIPLGIRKDIVKVITDNQPFSEALIVLSMLNYGLPNPEQAARKFQHGLLEFIGENKTNEFLILFFQQHFLNFERLDPAKYQNFELNRLEYLLLVADYLKIQSEIF